MSSPSALQAAADDIWKSVTAKQAPIDWSRSGDPSALLRLEDSRKRLDLLVSNVLVAWMPPEGELTSLIPLSRGEVLKVSVSNQSGFPCVRIC